MSTDDLVWEDMSEQQRLVILSVLLEISDFPSGCTSARGVNVRLLSGLGERKFQDVVDQLINKGQLSTDAPKDSCRGRLRPTKKTVAPISLPAYAVD